MESKIYNQAGKEISSVNLPENIFGLPWNEDLVHQVVVGMEGNARIPIAHAKTRGEVAGSGIKPWRQKGTGKARHGSRRSPIWVGGGVSHGPRNERDYSRKINKKMKNKALFTVLSAKLKDGEVIFLDEISFRVPKTKEAKSIISSISKILRVSDEVKKSGGIARRKNAAFIALQNKDKNILRSFNNFGNLEIGEVKDLNVLDLLRYKYLIITDPVKSIATLSCRLK